MIAIRVPDRLVRPAKWVGYPAFALLVFVVALYETLPRDRIKDLLETDVSSWLNADVVANDFGLTLFSGPGVSAGQVVIKSRPLGPEKPQRWSADDVVVHFNLVRLLRGFPDTSFHGRIGKGTVDGSYRYVPEELALTVDASGVPLGDLPGLSAPGGLPLAGQLDLKADLNAPKGLAAQSNGSAQLTVADGAIGDGKAKLVIPGDPMLAQGLTVPKIQLGRVSGRVTIEKGRATLREVRGHSKDLDVEIEGWIELRDPLPLSILHLYLKVKPADALIKREPTLEILVSSVGGMARRTDGFLGFALSGSASMPQMIPTRETPPGLAPSTAPSPSPSRGAIPPSVATPNLPSPPPTHFAPPVPAPTLLPPPPAVVEAPPPPPPVAAPPTTVEAVAPPPTTGPPMIPPTTSPPTTAVPGPAMRLGGGAMRPMIEPDPAPPEGGRAGSETGGDAPLQ